MTTAWEMDRDTIKETFLTVLSDYGCPNIEARVEEFLALLESDAARAAEPTKLASDGEGVGALPPLELDFGEPTPEPVAEEAAAPAPVPAAPTPCYKVQ